jgi:hypothetical protein
MQVTTGPHKHLVTVLVAASILLSSLLLVVAVGGVPHGNDPDPSGVATTGDTTSATSGDTGYVNPWKAGNAAALRALAELGRQTQVDTCP